MGAVANAPAQLWTPPGGGAFEHGGAGQLSHRPGVIPAAGVRDDHLQLPRPSLQIRQQQRQPAGFLQGWNYNAQPCHGLRSLQ